MRIVQPRTDTALSGTFSGQRHYGARDYSDHYYARSYCFTSLCVWNVEIALAGDSLFGLPVSSLEPGEALVDRRVVQTASVNDPRSVRKCVCCLDRAAGDESSNCTRGDSKHVSGVCEIQVI